METLSSILLTIHILAIVLLAAPFYALMTVNQRALWSQSFNYHTDSYMEDIIRASLSRCCIYNWTAMLSGLALIVVTKGSLFVVFASWLLAVKILLLLTNMGMRGYARHIIQPKIDELLSMASGDSVPEEVPGAIKALRMRRKKLTVVCLFDILVLVILGVQLAVKMSPAGVLVFILIAATIAWRAYNTTMKRGWF